MLDDAFSGMSMRSRNNILMRRLSRVSRRWRPTESSTQSGLGPLHDHRHWPNASRVLQIQNYYRPIGYAIILISEISGRLSDFKGVSSDSWHYSQHNDWCFTFRKSCKASCDLWKGGSESTLIIIAFAVHALNKVEARVVAVVVVRRLSYGMPSDDPIRSRGEERSGYRLGHNYAAGAADPIRPKIASMQRRGVLYDRN